MTLSDRIKVEQLISLLVDIWSLNVSRFPFCPEAKRSLRAVHANVEEFDL